MSRDPNHGGTDSVLPVLAVGDETSFLGDRVTKLSKFQELSDLGSESVPDSIERRVEDSVDGLGGEMRVSTLGIFMETRAVEVVGVVGRDTVAVHGSLPVRDDLGGESGAIRGDGEGKAPRSGFGRLLRRDL